VSSFLFSFGDVSFKRCKADNQIRTSLLEEHLLESQRDFAMS